MVYCIERVVQTASIMLRSIFCRFRLQSSAWEVASGGQPSPRLHASMTVARQGQVYLSGGYVTLFRASSREQEVIWTSGDVWQLNRTKYAHDTTCLVLFLAGRGSLSSLFSSRVVATTRAVYAAV